MAVKGAKVKLGLLSFVCPFAKQFTLCLEMLNIFIQLLISQRLKKLKFTNKISFQALWVISLSVFSVYMYSIVFQRFNKSTPSNTHKSKDKKKERHLLSVRQSF